MNACPGLYANGCSHERSLRPLSKCFGVVLNSRLITAVILIPIAIVCICEGDWLLLALVTLLLTLAVVEFCRLVARNGFRPTTALSIGLVWILLLNAQFPTLSLLQPGLAVILLGSLAWHVFHHQRYQVADWTLTVTGGLYLGLCGAHLIALRQAPNDGLGWTLIVIASTAFVDSGAYFVGSTWGQHKLSPTLSSGKTWEGYIGGVIVGTLATILWSLLWRAHLGPSTPIGGKHGLFLGLFIATLTPLGDLSISMIKRQVGAKDSGHLFPGHGGALDRVDSMLWAAVIGYYYVLWFTI
jgi:phosphatidate cytidylyltransferase